MRQRTDKDTREEILLGPEIITKTTYKITLIRQRLLADQSRQHWSAACVSSQIRGWRLPEWANHRNKQLDFTADFDVLF